MGRKRITEVPAEVAQVREGVEAWRGQKGQSGRMPEALWSAAADAARQYGIHRVSRALRLDYYHLKRRLGEPARRDESGAVFVELAAARLKQAGGICLVELEKGNGVKLRVSVPDAGTVDWCRVKEAFLEA